MPLNLIVTPWIPVIRQGGPDVIRPDQIAEPDVLRLNWPRPDLNLACLEMLVGLVYLAAPPGGEDGRADPPDATALKAAMAPLAPAFDLLGDGPRFLQDVTPLDGAPNPPDMLFIDSAGESTAKKNADLMVKRGRYAGLDLPLAAMALYALQNFAPSGGAGNRTSMRGGGPMVTLVRPDGGRLWEIIWANVPEGTPLLAEDLRELPWMRPCETSEKGKPPYLPDEGANSPEPEAFFGQPRRLRLVEEGGVITGVVQRPYGTNYEGWTHPLSPYYRDSKGNWLPVHPKPGRFGYRNWRGVILQTASQRRAAAVDRWIRENPGQRCDLIVGGWAMANMNPLDFIWSEQPLFALTGKAEENTERMVQAAEQAAFALFACIRDGAEESAATLAREAFFEDTEPSFTARVGALCQGKAFDVAGWLADMRGVALRLFDAAVLPNLPDLGESKRQKAVAARGKLLAAFAGHPPFARKIFEPLGLDLPARRKRKDKT